MNKNLEMKRYWIWFSLIINIGSKKKKQLLIKYKSPEIIYNLNKKSLLKNRWLTDKQINMILDKNIKDSVSIHIEYMKKNNIDILSYTDDLYPKVLKEIYDFPISIYIKGNSDILNNDGIAIIGCRDSSIYGQKAAKYFAYNLGNKKFNIISGLAKGIDSYAHIGCLSSNGKTIAVLGNGLDMIYPKENEILAKKIIEEGGAIISEYPVGVKPLKNNFPARNRIVSGMSKKIIVIEAKKRSGTLITVDFALEQGRDIFVVPGNINEYNSIGTNDLIKQGAMIVTTYLDVIA